ncbi:adenosylcobinamide-phosphate synthase CbiB [Oscillospiraceae bacterium LTW-04]|nr:adenosylcobinamide-phosphate synthase CbiB [Oscillospiraceae bacterium MB24-C1]
MAVLTAILLGFGLDWLFGDPVFIPHLVVGIGKIITRFERGLRKAFFKTPNGELAAGTVLAIGVPLVSFGVCHLVLWLSGLIHPAVRLTLAGFVCWQCLAARSLAQAGERVEKALASSKINDARRAVAQVVGRDTAALDRPDIIRAAVETVAENTCDGVIAPLFWLTVGGAPFGVLYKAVNTLDSMVGYKNEKYLYFGRASARLDDVMNYIPARISALLMIASAWLCRFDAENAWRIFKRDRYNHKSPNSAQSESVCAGALGIILGGNAVYFGKLVKKPTIGDALRDCERQDIGRVNRLMLCTAVLGLLMVILIRGIPVLWTIVAAR